MIQVTGRYEQQTFKLDRPLALAEGAYVVIQVIPADEATDGDGEWSELATSRLEEEWDNPGDAIYDDWRTLYGVPAR